MALTLDPAALARRQLQVVLLLDTSGSMQGDRIASLNYALRATLPELREVAAENPEIETRVRVLRFGDTAEWVIADGVSTDALAWPDLTAGGHTALGAALAMAAEALTDSARGARQLPAVLVLASDGYPTDDIDAGFDALFANPAGAAATRIAIAIGSDADTGLLNRFIGNPALQALRAGNAAELVQHIRWATTAPVKAASTPTNAPDPIAALARTVERSTAASSELIW